MMKIEFITERLTNITPDNQRYMVTVFAVMDNLPKCKHCQKIIDENNQCYFCELNQQFFCYDCWLKDIFVFHKYMRNWKPHGNILCTIKLKKPE
jgi:recombinational DNA repair protein RecR